VRQLIAGNWKMHGRAADVARIVAPLIDAAGRLDADLLVCPPATLVTAAAALVAGSAVGVGAQDCHKWAQGACTGDISAAMLFDAGARFVIIGHSERRTGHGETDALVRAKAVAAVGAGLTPIVCVGEDEPQRLAGRAGEVVRLQLAGSLPDGFAGVIAYEPLWAIGTGRVASADQIAAIHACLRAALVEQLGVETGGGTRILYGGSVKPENAAEVLAVPEVGGALVGGASLDPAAFLAIARAAA
jgi:triosephosphate isomerase